MVTGVVDVGYVKGKFWFENSLTQSEGRLTGGHGGGSGGRRSWRVDEKVFRVQKLAVEYQNLCGMSVYR